MIKRNSTLAIRSHKEVAEILTSRGMRIGKARVWQIEQIALKKMRQALLEIGKR